MKIASLTAADGIGGYYWRDQEAIARGAVRNGFLYDGAPVTPGFDSIIQVSSTVLLTAQTDTGRELLGDCATVNHAFRSGRQRAPVARTLTDDRIRPWRARPWRRPRPSTPSAPSGCRPSST